MTLTQLYKSINSPHMCKAGKTIGNMFGYGMGGGFAFGFMIGLVPNKVHLEIDNKKYNNVMTPLLGGLVGMAIFPCSSLIIMNWFFNSTCLDKAFDQYDYYVVRSHQYNSRNNKYAYPSSIRIKMKSKKENN